jgi:hypothetical protein
VSGDTNVSGSENESEKETESVSPVSFELVVSALESKTSSREDESETVEASRLETSIESASDPGSETSEKSAEEQEHPAKRIKKDIFRIIIIL